MDIDSSSLGASVVELSDDKPTISMVTRVPLGSGALRDPGALVPLLKDALLNLLPSYAKAYPKLRTVSVVAASPWFLSTVRTLSSKSEKPTRVSDSSVRRIVREHRKTEHESQGKTTLEAFPVSVLVNGYRSRLTKAVQGQSLSVTLYESIADNQLIETVTAAVQGVAPKAGISWHTTPLAYAETLLRISDEDHATVVDVGGEVTDIIILSHQNVAYVGSVPIGSRTIARAVAGNKEDMLGDALSRLAMFSSGELSQKEMETTAAQLTEISKEWQREFLKVLGEAGNIVPVPHRVFVVGERDELPWFTQVVSGAESRGQRPLPKTISPDFFAGLVRYGEGGMFDASLILDALFFHMRGRGTESVFGTPPVLYSVQ